MLAKKDIHIFSNSKISMWHVKFLYGKKMKQIWIPIFRGKWSFKDETNNYNIDKILRTDDIEVIF